MIIVFAAIAFQLQISVVLVKYNVVSNRTIELLIEELDTPSRSLLPYRSRICALWAQSLPYVE